MSADFPDLVDHLISLMHGSITGLDRSIASGRFKHVDDQVELHFMTAVDAPFPFDIMPDTMSGEWPGGVEMTLAQSRSQHDVTVSVRVGYASRPHKSLLLLKDIYRDAYQIIRSVGDSDSWVAETSFENVTMLPWSVGLVAIPGDRDVTEVMYILEQPITLTLSEDYS
jgi:hypothetical protein